MSQSGSAPTQLAPTGGMPPYTGKLLTWSFSIGIIPPIVLVAAIATKSLYLLDYVHVICGGTWTGFDIFMGVVMTRIMRSLEIPQRVEIREEAHAHDFLYPSITICNCDNSRHLSCTIGGQVQPFFALDYGCWNSRGDTDCAGIRRVHAEWTKDIHRVCEEQTRHRKNSKAQHAKHSARRKPGNLPSNYHSNHGTFGSVLIDRDHGANRTLNDFALVAVAVLAALSCRYLVQSISERRKAMPVEKWTSKEYRYFAGLSSVTLRCTSFLL